MAPAGGFHVWRPPRVIPPLFGLAVRRPVYPIYPSWCQEGFYVRCPPYIIFPRTLMFGLAARLSPSWRHMGFVRGARCVSYPQCLFLRFVTLCIHHGAKRILCTAPTVCHFPENPNAWPFGLSFHVTIMVSRAVKFVAITKGDGEAIVAGGTSCAAKVAAIAKDRSKPCFVEEGVFLRGMVWLGYVFAPTTIPYTPPSRPIDLAVSKMRHGVIGVETRRDRPRVTP